MKGLSRLSLIVFLQRFGKFVPVIATTAGISMAGLFVRPAMGDALYAWGDNVDGELGNGTTTGSLSPIVVPGMTSGVTSIGGNQSTSLAVKGGAAYAWGFNLYGDVGNGTLTPSKVLAPYAIPSLSGGVTAVAGAAEQSSAIRNSAVYSWGDNDYGEVGDGTRSPRLSPVATNVLTSGVTAIASAGNAADHTFAVQNGAVYAWGYANSFGDLGTGSDATVTSPVALSSLSSGITLVAAGQNNGAAIMNGALYAWGYNNYGTVGDGTYTERDTPVPVPSMTSGVTDVAFGNIFMLVVKGGAVYGCGDNSIGELGNSTTITTNVPIQILPASDSIIAVSAGEDSGYALSSNGSIWVWGYNGSGQLGIGNTINQLSPVQLFAPAGDRFTAISAESISALALVAPVPEPAGPLLLIPCAAVLLCQRERRRV